MHFAQQVDADLESVLIDHAHCEKKAAGVAMNLLFSYVEHAELTRAMTEIVQEELDHFHQVRAILDRRRIRFYKLGPSQYGGKLHELVDKQEPQRAVDRLLVAGLIEARSCERFGLLRDRLAEQNIRVDRFDVDVRQDGAGSQADPRGWQQQQQSQQQADQSSPRRTAQSQPKVTTVTAPERVASVQMVGDTGLNLVV